MLMEHLRLSDGGEGGSLVCFHGIVSTSIVNVDWPDYHVCILCTLFVLNGKVLL